MWGGRGGLTPEVDQCAVAFGSEGAVGCFAPLHGPSLAVPLMRQCVSGDVPVGCPR